MKAARITIALVMLGLAVAWLAWMRAGEEVAAIGAAPKTERAVSASEQLEELTRLETASETAIGANADRTAMPDEPARRAGLVASRRIPASSVGRLIVRAVDATTDEPLWSLRARVASDTRFADERSRDASGEIELPLTPGSYSIVVSAPGYESLELERAQVTAGELTRPAPARLRGGAGRIAVNVWGTLPGGRNLGVELIGAGRRPCEHCGDAAGANASNKAIGAAARAWQRDTPCASCGFARERSRLSLGAARRLEFKDLASGNYALRVSDDNGFVVGDARELALRGGESTTVTFDLSSLRYVELECVDADGRSLSDEWRLRLAETQELEIVTLETAFRSNPIALKFFDDARNPIATASLVPPMLPGSFGFSVSGRRSATQRFGAVREWVDRARQPDDRLWPEPAAAHFGPSSVACEVEDSGLARVGPLPSSRLELHAKAENFAADAIVPASRETTRVTLKLQATFVDPNARPEFATYSAYEMAGVK